MSGQTRHGTRERVSWTVTVTDQRAGRHSSSSMLFGEREQEARDYYAKRAKYLHRGYRVDLGRLVTTEAWIQREDAIETKVKS